MKRSLIILFSLVIFVLAFYSFSQKGDSSSINVATPPSNLVATASIPVDGRLPEVAQNHIPVCPGPADSDSTRCHSRVLADEKGKPTASVTVPPSGALGPSQFHAAYAPGVTTVSGNKILAIVIAYDNPNALSDLNYYSNYYKIPTLPNCTLPIASSTVPCFQKLNQRGSATQLPKFDQGWALESSLDLQSAHAMCQNCSILLVEADSNSYSNLLAAFDTAVAKGAKVISNSYGGGEFSSQTSNSYDGHFNIKGIAITFSSGDSGYGLSYPASSQYVTAVGGTRLNMNGNTYVSEVAWSGAGSGCSAYSSKPAWQSAYTTSPTDCGTKRTVADVSADADPVSGAAIYNSNGYYGQKGWFKVGGTSLAAPLVAGVYALAPSISNLSYGASLPYSLGTNSNLHDVASGKNTSGTCSPTLLCTSGLGYDGPTGLGTPNGTSAF